MPDFGFHRGILDDTWQGSVKLSDYEVWNSEKISLNNEKLKFAYDIKPRFDRTPHLENKRIKMEGIHIFVLWTFKTQKEIINFKKIVCLMFSF